MLTCNPVIDQIFTVGRDSSFFSDLQKQIRLIKEIRNFKFDMAIDLTWNERAAVLAYMSGAKRRLSYRWRGEKRASIYHFYLQTD